MSLSPSALIVALAFYPIVYVAGPIIFFSIWPEKRTAFNAASSSKEAANVEVSLLVVLYGTLITLTLLWEYFFPFSDTHFYTKGSLSNALLGGYLGLSWAGISIWLLALGAATGRMHREIPGLRAPLSTQFGVWLGGALAEEMWRVVVIAALLASGYSPVFSVVAASVAFGSAHLRLGIQRTAVASLEGAFFGFLFFLRGSFLAPFGAHLAVQSVYLWGVGQLSQGRESRRTWQIPGTRCPVCRTPLRLLQIKLTDEFECSACKETLSLSDGCRNTMRFSAALGFLFVVFFSLILLNDLLPSNLAYWFLYPVSYGVATSVAFLYKRAFTRLFPPRLQRGKPYFVALNLENRQRSKLGGSEHGGDT